MALHAGIAVNAQNIDAVDLRLALAGLVLTDQFNVPRNGLFPFSNTGVSRVSSTTAMRVSIAGFTAVIGRASSTYGAILVANDGSVNVALDAAPTANSRIDHIYLYVPDVVQGDSAALPYFGVAKGTAAASPTVPAIPSGAMSFATVQIPSTATTTQSANVIITETWLFTTVSGGRLWYRTQAEMQADRNNVQYSTQAWVVADYAKWIQGQVNHTWVQEGTTPLSAGVANTSGGLVSAGQTSSAYNQVSFTAAVAGTIDAFTTAYIYASSTSNMAGRLSLYLDGVEVPNATLVHNHARSGFAIWTVNAPVVITPGSHTIASRITANSSSATMEVWDVNYNYSLNF